MGFLIAGLSFLALIIALLLVLVIRASLFRPKPAEPKKVSAVLVNSEKAVGDLAEMIKCKTISSDRKETEDEAEFERFEALLPKLFPRVMLNALLRSPQTARSSLSGRAKITRRPPFLWRITML